MINDPVTTDVSSDDKILSIDIGGSHIKATILNTRGELQMDYQRVETPNPATPEKVTGVIESLVKSFPVFNKVSVGFPGYVKDGVVMTAPNLGTKAWAGFKFSQKLQEVLGSPVKLVNDADLQGMGVVSGKGFEIVVTLGTGFGTALLMNGQLLPHLELAHHPLKKNTDYDVYIGEKALIEEGDARWNKRMKKVISILKTVFNYDHLYIGGGNAKKINFELDENITIVSNKDGIKGGARLWYAREKVAPQ